MRIHLGKTAGLAALAALGLLQRSAATPLVEIAPIHLTDFTDTPIARPNGLALDADGGFYVADGLQAHALRFSKSGQPVRRYGSRGDGPGELRHATAVAFVNDSVIAIADNRHRNIVLFDRRSGKYVKQFAVPGLPSALHADRGILWIGALNAEAHLGVARVNIATGDVTSSVATPASYKAGGPVASIRSDVMAVPMGADVLVGFGGTDYLVRIHSNGSADTLAIPVKARTGVPIDVDERIKRARRSEDYYTMMSSLFALEPVRPDVVLAAHLDISMRPGVTFPVPAGGPPVFLYTFYVSLLDLRAHRACVDLPVPVSHEQYPAVAVRGDTLFAIDQDSLSTDQPWMIRRFVIHEERCTWQ